VIISWKYKRYTYLYILNY